MTHKLLLFTCALLLINSIDAQNLYVRKTNNSQEMYALSTVKPNSVISPFFLMTAIRKNVLYDFDF